MKTFLGLIALLISIISCKGGGGGGGGTAAITSHEGIWAVCEDYDGNSDSINDSSLLSILSISKDALAMNRTNYSGISCVAGNEEYRFENGFSYTRAGDAYTALLKTDIYTPLSASDVTWDNTNTWCGINNWVINVARDTIGQNCDGVTSILGDVTTDTFLRTGNSLTVDGETYVLAIGTDLTPAGLTLPNGSYAYSDATGFAAFAILNSGNYNVYRYDLDSRTYNIETGTYTSSNNVVNFTVTSSIPGGCYSGNESRRFTTGLLGITMEFAEDNLIMFGLKVNYSESSFRSTYLGGGFSQGCF